VALTDQLALKEMFRLRRAPELLKVESVLALALPLPVVRVLVNDDLSDNVRAELRNNRDPIWLRRDTRDKRRSPISGELT
jgi:hypothetical protein